MLYLHQKPKKGTNIVHKHVLIYRLHLVRSCSKLYKSKATVEVNKEQGRGKSAT